MVDSRLAWENDKILKDVHVMGGRGMRLKNTAMVIEKHYLNHRLDFNIYQCKVALGINDIIEVVKLQKTKKGSILVPRIYKDGQNYNFICNYNKNVGIKAAKIYHKVTFIKPHSEKKQNIRKSKPPSLT